MTGTLISRVPLFETRRLNYKLTLKVIKKSSEGQAHDLKEIP